MQRASTIFTSEARQRINQAVADAESHTSAEIVPVVATVSGRYDRAEDLCGLWVAICSFAAVWLVFQRVDPNIGGWDGPKLSIGILAIVVILILGFVIGTIIASHVGWLRRLFTRRAEMVAEANERARQLFFDQRVHHTRGGTGILIFVSLFERTAVVLADEVVTEKLGEKAVDELCAQLTAKLRDGDVPLALFETIQSAGRQLAAVLPRESADTNELPDALVTID